jgi:hypothetical protein
MSQEPENKPTLHQLWLMNPQAYYAQAGKIQEQMVLWWQEEFNAPCNIMNAPLTDTELLLLEELFISTVGLPSAVACFAAAHGLRPDDQRAMPVLVRVALFYGFLVGKGLLHPKAPPALPEDFLQMMDIWQEEQKLKLAQAGKQMKVLQ